MWFSTVVFHRAAEPSADDNPYSHSQTFQRRRRVLQQLATEGATSLDMLQRFTVAQTAQSAAQRFTVAQATPSAAQTAAQRSYTAESLHRPSSASSVASSRQVNGNHAQA